jgi:hypothetical protein
MRIRIRNPITGSDGRTQGPHRLRMMARIFLKYITNVPALGVLVPVHFIGCLWRFVYSPVLA